MVRKEKLSFIGRIIEWLLYMFFYALVFFTVSNMFDSFYIDVNNAGIYSFLAVIIIYILNKTIKPILFFLTIPITGITLGLFYPCINLFILKITDWILGSHFKLENIFIAFFIAVLISLMNTLMDNIIIKPIIRRFKKSE
ncbi:MAG: phage holin family protein [Bacilli bacterium]|nr:phage holin family protein [Bacilli bacterium]